MFVLVLCSSQAGAWPVSGRGDEAGWTSVPTSICSGPCGGTSREVPAHATR